MSLRSGLVAGVTVFLGHAALAACSSFSAADPVVTPEIEAGPPDASPVPEAGAVADAAFPRDGSCDAESTSPSPVSLYVFGGNVTDANGNVTGEAGTIYRAPILCDGSLGAWLHSGQLPRGMQYGVAGVVGDHLVLTGGLSNLAPKYSDTVYVYPHGTGGGLGDYTPTALAIVPRWHHVSVATGDELVLLGGADANGNQILDVETLRFEGDRVYAVGQVSLDHPRIRSAAAYSSGRIVVLGPSDDPSAADVAGDGTVGTWRTLTPGGRRDFDLVSATDGSKMYFVGGSNGPVNVTVATVGMANAVTLAPGASLAVPGISGSASATWGGRMYIVSGSLRTGVVSTTFTTSGVAELHTEASFPEARLGHVAVVF